MDDWVWLPQTPEAWPKRGGAVTFMRGDDIAECVLIVDRVDVTTNTVYFTSSIPSDIQVGDCLVGLVRA